MMITDGSMNRGINERGGCSDVRIIRADQKQKKCTHI